MPKRSTMALLVVAVMVVLGAFSVASADCGDGGSPENFAGSCETAQNQVQCSEDATATPVTSVYASAEGIETCNDGSGAFPLQGRIGASSECECIYADGDANNDSPLNGWAKIDQNGVNCDDGQVSYNQGPGSACF
ncbi:MAG TPA: hypothetical protein VGB52_13185 [Actinomycetota bacterium]